MGFWVNLADKSNTANIVHWNSLHTPRRDNPFEQTELMPLGAEIKFIENVLKVVDELLKKGFTVVVCTDCNTL